MRVRFKGRKGEEPYLRNGKSYIVIAIEFTNMPGQLGAIRYMLENDMGEVEPYTSNMFEIESSRLSTTWIFNKRKENHYLIISKDLAYNSFLEDYYNGDEVAISKMVDAKAKIYLEELSDDEILYIIKHNVNEKIDVVLYGLTQERNDSFIDEVINYCRLHLERDEDERLLISHFKYLSTFNKKQIEDFFIEYLSITLMSNSKLISIVNEYFDA